MEYIRADHAAATVEIYLPRQLIAEVVGGGYPATGPRNDEGIRPCLGAYLLVSDLALAQPTGQEKSVVSRKDGKRTLPYIIH